MEQWKMLTSAAVLALFMGSTALVAASTESPVREAIGAHQFVDANGDGVCDYYQGLSDGTGNREIGPRRGKGNGTGTCPAPETCTCNGAGPGGGYGPGDGSGPVSGTGTCEGTGPHGAGTGGCPNQ